MSSVINYITSEIKKKSNRRVFIDHEIYKSMLSSYYLSYEYVKINADYRT